MPREASTVPVETPEPPLEARSQGCIEKISLGNTRLGLRWSVESRGSSLEKAC